MGPPRAPLEFLLRRTLSALTPEGSKLIRYTPNPLGLMCLALKPLLAGHNFELPVEGALLELKGSATNLKGSVNPH